MLFRSWNRAGQIASWNQLSSQYKPNWDTKYAWQILYDAIGHCNLFLDLLVKLNPDIGPEKKLRFAAEVKCVKAYYYSRLLERFGPVPIIDTYPDMNMPASVPHVFETPALQAYLYPDPE